MDVRVQQEQNVLHGKLNEIDKLLNELSAYKTTVLGKADQIIISKRKEKIEKIKYAIPIPYLGRMDAIQSDGKRIAYYIGKTGISNEDGTKEIVIDWRSDFGALYTTYSGGKKNWPGVGNLVGKRQITIERQTVNRVVDIGLMEENHPQAITTTQLISETKEVTKDQFLDEILSNTPDSYQLHEIISSLQEEQNEIIRLPMDHPIIVQGVAGSGKSSVAFHRISYLLFKYEETLNPENILVIAPNQMFISYMQSVIPELDIKGIKQDTFMGFALKYLPFKTIQSPHLILAEKINNEIESIEKKYSSKYKNSTNFKNSLDLYLQHQTEYYCPRDSVYINRDFSISNKEITKIFEGYKHLPLNKCREQVIISVKNLINDNVKNIHNKIENEFQNIVEHWVQTMPEGNTHRKNLFVSLEHAKGLKKEKAFTEGKVAKDKFINNWGKIDPLELYYQIFDQDLLQGLDPTLDKNLAKALCTDEEFFAIQYDDLAALLYIENKVNGIQEKYKYMIVDEAQDMSPFQIYMLKQFTSSMTILGDITQSIYPFGLEKWDEIDASILGSNSIKRMQMDTSYRSTHEIMNTANKVIENSKQKLPKIIPVNRKGGLPKIKEVLDSQDLLKNIRESIKYFQNKGYKKIAIIGKDLQQTEGIFRSLKEQGLKEIQLIQSDDKTLTESIILIPSYLVKGMEFDAVIVPNANAKRFTKEGLDVKLLYICITRAHHELHIYYHGTVSPLLHSLTLEKISKSKSFNDIL